MTQRSEAQQQPQGIEIDLSREQRAVHFPGSKVLKIIDALNEKILHALLLAVLIFVPLIICGVFVDQNMESSKFFSLFLQTRGDLFTYGKSVFLVFFAALFLPFLIVHLAFKFFTRNKEGRFAFSGSWAGPTWLLTLFSFALWILTTRSFGLLPQAAWMGFFEHYEGVLVHLSYLILGFGVYTVGTLHSISKTVQSSVFLGGLCVAAAGGLQYFGWPPWELPSFRRTFDFIYGSGYHYRSLWGEGTFSSSLFNPNWTGSFFALLVPWSSFYFLNVVQSSADRVGFSKKEQGQKFYILKMVAVFFCALFFTACLCATGSRASFGGASVSVVICELLFLYHLVARKQGLQRHLFALFALGAGVVAICSLVPSHRSESIGHEMFPTLRLETEELLLQQDKAEVEDEWRIASKGAYFSKQAAQARGIALQTRGKALLVAEGKRHNREFALLPEFPRRTSGLVKPWQNTLTGLSLVQHHWLQQNFSLTARRRGSGQPLPLEIYPNGAIGFMHPEFWDVVLYATNVPFEFLLRLGDQEFPVYLGPQVVGVPLWGKIYAVKEVAQDLLFLPDSFASFRGYIWKRTLPVIREHWLFGVGAGAFAEAFPQDDVVGKLRSFARFNVMVEKPHSQYFLQAVSFGLPGLLLFILACFSPLLFFVQWGFSQKFSKRFQRVFWLGLPFFAGALSYLLATFFIDSTPGVTPLFWAFLGLTGRCVWNKESPL